MPESVDPFLRSLTVQRHHVLGIVDDLTAEQMRRPVLPSGWNCVGLVHHLATEVERFWFRAVMANDQDAWAATQAQTESGWVVDLDVDPSDVLAQYRYEIECADTIIRATPLDTPPAAWPADMFGDFKLADLRAMLLHVITETACHAGHLDAARELLDGRQWMVL